MQVSKRNYEALAKRAQELGLPIAWKTDLTKHDFDACSENPDSRRFIWAIGETGTNMVWLDPCQVNPERARDTVNYWLDNDRAAVHYYDGAKLTEITPDTAIHFLENK